MKLIITHLQNELETLVESNLNKFQLQCLFKHENLKEKKNLPLYLSIFLISFALFSFFINFIFTWAKYGARISTEFHFTQPFIIIWLVLQNLVVNFVRRLRSWKYLDSAFCSCKVACLCNFKLETANCETFREVWQIYNKIIKYM